MQMQMRAAVFEFAFFFVKIYSKYAIHIFLREMMGTSHFYIVIDSKVEWILMFPMM